MGRRLEPAPAGSHAANDASAPANRGYDRGPHIQARRKSADFQPRGQLAQQPDRGGRPAQPG
eukprot:11185496-Lingulodinium_polyedra.AAC.1